MSKKILVVEDMDDSRHLMKFLLELSGYQVVEAINGQEAVETVRNMPVDLILMDISMPVMDGLTATRLIREFEEDTKKIPIIAVTALTGHYYEALEAGCNDLIAKPVDHDRLERVLKQYCV